MKVYFNCLLILKLINIAEYVHHKTYNMSEYNNQYHITIAKYKINRYIFKKL